MSIPENRQSLGTHERIRGRIVGPEGNRNSTGNPTESTNQETWGGISETKSPNKEHTRGWTYASLYKRSLVFMWLLKKLEQAISQNLLPVHGYVLLTRLLCLAHWERMHLSS